jgi:two-component system, LuxR family, response regulator FixJ
MQVGVFMQSITGVPLHRQHACQPKLSPREIDVFRLLAGGLGTKEIAANLEISVKTVEAYRSRLMLKLRAHSLVELVHRAIRYRLIDVD